MKAFMRSPTTSQPLTAPMMPPMRRAIASETGSTSQAGDSS